MSVQVAVALAIFAVTFLLVFTERINRTVAALLGAMAMVVTGVLTQGEALEAISFPAIGSIIGILILVSVVRSSGLFNYVAIKAVKAVKGRPAALMIVFSLLAAAMGAVLGGTATMIIIGSLIALTCRQLNLRMPPYLMAAAIMSSVGGGLLLTGGAANILISQAAGFTFVDFFTNSFPISLLLTVLTSVFLIWYFKIEREPRQGGEILLDEAAAIPDRRKFYISTALFAATIILFMLSDWLGLTIEMIAMGAGVVGLLLTGFDPERAFKEVQWEMLFFLVGIFVVIGGVEKSGAFQSLALLMAPAVKTGAGRLIVLWLTSILAGVANSTPTTVALIPVIRQSAAAGGVSAAPLFWALLLAINFGNNLTPIGSTSSILAMGIGRDSGQQFGFKEFLKVSVIVTLLHLAILSGWVLLRY